MSYISLASVLLFCSNFPASASFSVTYTGDNVIGAWWQNGGNPIQQPQGANWNNWRVADNEVLNLGVGHYQLIFRVENLAGVGSSNPAGFLAEITGDGVSGDLLTGVNWEWAYAYRFGEPVPPTPTDFNTLDWETCNEYGYNGESNIPWTISNSEQAIAGIADDSDGANWIWNHENGAFWNGDHLYFRGEFNVVPEPATLSLLGLGLLSLGFFATS